ncbi:uncharacterized protein LOC111055225 isoform X2 [Nilaparvata lugens]|uniref:uncharacterized protein LOC111055225 isoform X2 n=1 Tax=Nilaparvata lugens TaxID=108931 RepID=UPI00193E4A1C|nr:uncharacterized protein LOC111055225 isoform X2 [Nilaparvata lugens]
MSKKIYSRTDKILNLALKGELNKTKHEPRKILNSIENINRPCVQNHKKTSPSFLQLYDEGKWEEFYSRLDKNYHQIFEESDPVSKTQVILDQPTNENGASMSCVINTDGPIIAHTSALSYTPTEHEGKSAPCHTPEKNEEEFARSYIIERNEGELAFEVILDQPTNENEVSMSCASINTVNPTIAHTMAVSYTPGEHEVKSAQSLTPEENGGELALEGTGKARKSLNFAGDNSLNKFKNVKTKRTLRNWNRRNFCIFCRTLVSNFRRHQLRNHPLEKEVIDFLSECDPDLKERKRKRQAIFDELRKRGNYLYNSNIDSKSEILPIRRPDTTKKEVAYHKYVHCVHCLGAFSRKTFYRHESKCPKKILADAEVNTNSLPPFDSSKASNNVKDCRNHVLKTFSTMIFPSSVEDEELVKKIFPIMKKDEISLVAMNDTLIKSIASQFLKNHMDKKDEYNASRKMRDASALLLYCRKDPAIKNLIDCFKPKHFCLVMEAAQKLSGFDESTGAVKVIGMPARLAYVIQEGAKLKSDTAILSDKISRATKETIKTETSEFLQLFKNKWKYYISTNAEKTRKKQTSVTPIIMPDDCDIKHMTDSVKAMEVDYYNELSQDVDANNYEKLCKCTIAHIILLNRRRPGEVARSELSHFLNRPQNECPTPDVLDSLTEDERMALPEVSVFMVPGKLLRSVPILLTKSMEKAINLLITCRSKLQIPPENPLLFARVYTLNPFDGSKILRELRTTCKLLKPNFLTATGLRHHIATKSQVFGDPEFTEKICQHLGHTSEIHKKNYRFPIQAMQRGQVGQKLLKLDGTWDEIMKKNCNTEADNRDKTLEPEMDGTWGEIIEKKNGITEPEADNGDKTPEPEHSNDPSYEYNKNYSSDSDSYSESQIKGKFQSRQLKARVRWLDCEKEVVIKQFANFIVQKKTPGKLLCEQIIRKNGVLKDRSWQQVNALIHNIFTKKVKLHSKFRSLLPGNFSF